MLDVHRGIRGVDSIKGDVHGASLNELIYQVMSASLGSHGLRKGEGVAEERKGGPYRSPQIIQ
jgi:hypothetical protein